MMPRTMVDLPGRPGKLAGSHQRPGASLVVTPFYCMSWGEWRQGRGAEWPGIGTGSRVPSQPPAGNLCRQLNSLEVLKCHPGCH